MSQTNPSRALAPVLTAGAVVLLAGPVAVAVTSNSSPADADPAAQVRTEIISDSTGGPAPVDPEPSTTTSPTTSPTPSPTPSSPSPEASSPSSPAGQQRQKWLYPRGSSFTRPTNTRPPASRPSATRPVAPTATPTLPVPSGAHTVTLTAPPPPPSTTTTITVTPPAAAWPAPVTTVTQTVTAPGLPGWTGGSLPAGGFTSTTGWHSGASGAAAMNGGFGNWRGKPVQVIAVWSDTSAAEQTAVSSIGQLDGFDGDVDIAVGGLAPGETWSQAAQGAYRDRWRQAVRTIAAHRSGKPGTTYVRFAHEMNGDWFTWKVNSGNVADFHTSWRMFREILAQEYPAAKMVFSPNSGSHSDIPVSQIYPGDEVVDVIGVDFYDGWPSVLDQSDWDENVNATEQGDQPRGPGAWQRFAAAHGKPISFPEWGVQFGDHPAFIKAMHDFLAANAAQPNDPNIAGKVIYDVYFDVAHEGNTKFMISGDANPQSAAMYRSLTWGS